MKNILSLIIIFFSMNLFAKKINFHFENTAINEIVKKYSEEAGAQFIYDSSLKGQATILSKEKIEMSEAYHLMSMTLAKLGYAISVQNNIYVVENARTMKTSLRSVETKLPQLKPERMITYIHQVKNLDAKKLVTDLRVYSSKDGEMRSLPGNKIAMTDWVSTIQSIHDILLKIQNNSKKSKK